jgi:hypothetical protein
MVAFRAGERQAGTAGANNAHDILDGVHCFGGDRARASRAVGQDPIDVRGVLHQPLHLTADRAELRDREIDQRVLEGRELRAAKFAQHVGFRRVVERGIDADQVVGLRPRLQSFFLARQRVGVGLGLADLLRDGVGVVGQVDARIIRRLGLRHLLRAVAQRHHARRRPLDDRLRQREEGVAEAV